jgi:hypothetical protein
MKLLYRISEWHALDKLRMHTEDSLRVMEECTKELGDLLRQFRGLTCSEFSTVELPREADARVRRRKGAAATADPEHPNAASATQRAPATTSSTDGQNGNFAAPEKDSSRSGRTAAAGRKPKVLNLLTVKLHFLGDYVRHIRLFGTTDSYSTQLVSPSIYHCRRMWSLTRTPCRVNSLIG